jgi:hypothetical protein
VHPRFGSGVTCIAILAAAVLSGCIAGPEDAASQGGQTGGSLSETQGAEAKKATFTNETGAIEGVVANDNGARVRQAHIAVIGLSLFGDTDKNGEFSISKVPPGKQRLRITADGYLSLEQEVKVSAKLVTKVNVTLAPKDPGGAGFREHLHDLWGSETQTTLFDGTVSLTYGTACGRMGIALNSGDACYTVPIVLARDVVVRPGTQRLEVTIDWAKQDAVKTVNFEYQAANAVKYEPGPKFNPKETHVIEVTPGMNDHGHQTYSVWGMRLRMEPTYATLVINQNHLNEQFIGPFKVRIEAFKGEIPTEGAHPRYWGKGDTLTLLDKASTTVTGLPRTRDPKATSCSASSICFVLPAKTIVPPGTTRLDVTLEYEPNTAAFAQFMTKKALSFRTSHIRPAEATLESLRHDAPDTSVFGKATWSLRIESNEPDAFYQTRSLWMFLLANEGKQAETQFTEDCYHYVAGCGGSKYTLSVVAVNEKWTPDLADPPE